MKEKLKSLIERAENHKFSEKNGDIWRIGYIDGLKEALRFIEEDEE